MMAEMSFSPKQKCNMTVVYLERIRRKELYSFTTFAVSINRTGGGGHKSSVTEPYLDNSAPLVNSRSDTQAVLSNDQTSESIQEDIFQD